MRTVVLLVLLSASACLTTASAQEEFEGAAAVPAAERTEETASDTLPHSGDPLREPVEASSVDSVEPSLHLTAEEYQYARGPRYTVTGELPFRETNVRPVPLALTGGMVAGLITGIHLYQQDAWWSDRRMPFHLDVDWWYAAQSDKLGHLFAGYFTSYIGYESLVTSGFKPATAAWLGPLLATGFQTYVEVEDGFSPFGFDPTDQVANVLGPAIFSAQHYVPWLQNVKFKWSYFPSRSLQDGVTEGHDKIVIDDYNSQSIWLSLKIGNVLPESVGWPKWLRLAAGHGAYNVDRWDENGALLPAGRRLFLALDYDLIEIAPDLGGFGNWIIQTMDFLHLPAPALQLAPHVEFFIAYPVEF